MTQGTASAKEGGLFNAIIRVFFYVYLCGMVLSGTYFNWTYARDNGFIKWLLLGQVVPTAKAMIWPYYAFASSSATSRSGSPDLRQGFPQSVQMFFIAIDALLEADARPEGITPDSNLRRVEVLLRRVADAGAKADRAELNAIYPGWGDHFIDDAVAHARFMIQVIDTGDPDAATRATAALLRWQKWWNKNRASLMTLLSDRYGS